MEKVIILYGCLLIGFITMAQDPRPAAPGVTYGAGTTADGAIPVKELEAQLQAGKFNGKVTGKVVAVSLEKGRRMEVEKAGSEIMMVKCKDYAFFMPEILLAKKWCWMVRLP